MYKNIIAKIKNPKLYLLFLIISFLIPIGIYGLLIYANLFIPWWLVLILLIISDILAVLSLQKHKILGSISFILNDLIIFIFILALFLAYALIYG
jgi:hypothetical protein